MTREEMKRIAADLSVLDVLNVMLAEGAEFPSAVERIVCALQLSRDDAADLIYAYDAQF